jgi:hypothetical protein
VLGYSSSLRVLSTVGLNQRGELSSSSSSSSPIRIPLRQKPSNVVGWIVVFMVVIRSRNAIGCAVVSAIAQFMDYLCNGMLPHVCE